MEKIEAKFKPVKFEFLEYNGNEIDIMPYISLRDQVLLAQAYLETLFEQENVALGLLSAKYGLILGVIESNTNLSTENMSVDDVINSDLWNKIKKNIRNFDELEFEISNAVKYARENIALEKSMGASFDKLSQKVMNFLDNVSKVDLSKDGVQKLLEALDREKKDINIIVDPSAVETPKKKTRTAKQ
jgi:hypothetical protein